MNSKAQFTSPCWSVENYVTKGLRAGTQLFAHVDFSLRKCIFDT